MPAPRSPGRAVRSRNLGASRRAPARLPGVSSAPADIGPIQRVMGNRATVAQQAVPALAARGLPARLKAGIETLSGMAMDQVRVHYASPEPERIGALAFARGADIHLAPGQERHLPHEAWHVVQQAQGRVRPTMQLKGGTQINDAAALEREATVMGDQASAGAGRGASTRGAPPPVTASASASTLGGVLQPWWDENKKWHDGPTPDPELFEGIKDAQGFVRWCPKGTAPKAAAAPKAGGLTITKEESGYLSGNGAIFIHVRFSDGTYISFKRTNADPYRWVYMDVREGPFADVGFSESDARGYRTREMKDWIAKFHPGLVEHWRLFRVGKTV